MLVFELFLAIILLEIIALVATKFAHKQNATKKKQQKITFGDSGDLIIDLT